MLQIRRSTSIKLKCKGVTKHRWGFLTKLHRIWSANEVAWPLSWKSFIANKDWIQENAHRQLAENLLSVGFHVFQEAAYDSTCWVCEEMLHSLIQAFIKKAVFERGMAHLTLIMKQRMKMSASTYRPT